MLECFNLLISTSRGNERNACREIWYLLNELGDVNPESDFTTAIGLVVARTSFEPIEASVKIRDILKNRPWELRYILKITPIERVIPADITAVTKLAQEWNSRIGADESYRVTVRKRHSELKSKDIVEAVASKINRRVDLDNPDKIFLVEVFSDVLGASILGFNDILAVEKEKQTFRR